MSKADTTSRMSAAVLEPRFGLERRRLAVEPWEVHSELVLVSPEVYDRARELLPRRDPDAFLTRPREPAILPADTADRREHITGLTVAVFGYALSRLIDTARSAFFVVAGIVVLAVLADVLR
jgi:hypothetical protein